MIEHKSFDISWKGLADDSGSVELYAAAFGNVDKADERIEPGAFKNLVQFKADAWLAVNHDWSGLGVATIEDAEQDARGLKIAAMFHSDPDSQKVRTIVKERIDRGKSVKASIGYKVLEDEAVKVDGKSIRSLKAIHLYEASIVNVPCNDQAGVIGVKSLMTVDELRGLINEYKSGRVLSAANRATLARLHQQHSAALADLQSLLDATDPDKVPLPVVSTEPAVPKSLLPELVQLYRESLAIRSRYSTASLERGY